MKKVFIGLIPLLIGAFFFIACDKIDKDDYLKEAPSGVWQGQKILIEEFTGQRCPNCPAAADVVKSLSAAYENIVVISIHAGDFAYPLPNSALYFRDYRTAEGNELNDRFNVQDYPAGMVNRIGSTVSKETEWGSLVVANYFKRPILTLDLSGSSFNEETKNVKLRVVATFIEESYDLNIVTAITEDKIISPQEYPPGTPAVENYEHNHVLRQMPFGSLGESFLAKALADESKEYSKDFRLRDDIEGMNCNLIIYIVNNASGEIVQVDEIPLSDIVNNL